MTTTHLVALHSPHFDDARLDADQFEGIRPVEDGAAVRSVVALDVDARRIRFGEVCPAVALTRQRPRQKLVVVHFLDSEKQQTGVTISPCLFLLIPFDVICDATGRQNMVHTWRQRMSGEYARISSRMRNRRAGQSSASGGQQTKLSLCWPKAARKLNEIKIQVVVNIQKFPLDLHWARTFHCKRRMLPDDGDLSKGK